MPETFQEVRQEQGSTRESLTKMNVETSVIEGAWINGVIFVHLFQ
jgi:hypothetical protein